MTVLAAAVMVIVWGSSSVATRVGMDSYSPGRLALFRFLITTVVLLAWIAITRMRVPPLRDWPGLIGIALVGISITQLAFVYGMMTVDPGTATFLMATIPVMAALLAKFVLKEHLTPAGWVGIALTVIGTTVLVLGKGQGIAYTKGALILLLGAFAEAVYYILQKPWLKRYSPVEVSVWTLLFSTLPLLIFLPGLGAEIRGATLEDTLAVVYVALGAGAVGYACLSYLNSRLPASIAAVLLSLMPPVALLTAWVWMGTPPKPVSLIGGAISLAGVLLVTLRGQAPRPSVAVDEPVLSAAD